MKSRNISYQTMINYKIIVSTGQNKPLARQRVDPKDPSFRSITFERSLKNCFWQPGQRVKLRGTSRLGTLQEVIKDINQINWTKNRPNYLLIRFDNGELALANPCQLKGTKK
jgi:hypothetical protein